VARLVLRLDSGPTVGVGHLARGLALAQAWRDTGGDVAAVSPAAPRDWVDRYAREGVEVRDADDTSSGAADDWTVLDGYRFTPADVRSARERAGRLLIVDDFGRAASHDADAVLDQNLGATAATYVDVRPGTDLLLGLRYALLRREFALARARAAQDGPPDGRNLVVALGGSPPAAAVELVDSAVAALRALAPDLPVERLAGAADVTEVFARARVGLSASGSTAWELCCCGVPTVLVPVADNQVPVAAAAAAAGAAVDAGWYADLTPAALAATVADLTADPRRRVTMAAAASALVDGRGARRVVARLRARAIGVRPATDADVAPLFEWANDPNTRASSFRPEPIAWDEHTRWFMARRRDPACALYIAESGGAPIGQVRFDADPACTATAEISVSVAPHARGAGWGPAVIAAATDRYLSDVPAVDRVVARIRPENGASQSAFDLAAYVVAPGEEPGVVRYARWRDGRDPG
jgi:spore coat polysaccharide biosynthesis predicted glycosyltransferase SpsG/RimJ/RimL family protein N-acetyltransferase